MGPVSFYITILFLVIEFCFLGEFGSGRVLWASAFTLLPLSTMFFLSVETTLLLELSYFKGDCFSLVWFDATTADFLRYPCPEFPLMAGGCCGGYCFSLFSSTRLALWFLFVPVPVPPEDSLWPAEVLSLRLVLGSGWEGSL